jgi:hypothetical protein
VMQKCCATPSSFSPGDDEQGARVETAALDETNGLRRDPRPVGMTV